MSSGKSRWLKLKVSGQIFETTSTTLLSCPDSMLAKMFNPESGLEPAHSEDGVYFLDADPKCFGVILNWLRYRKVMPDLETNLNNVAEVASFFGLEELVDELKMIGAVVVMSDFGHASEDYTGSCMGLYFKETDKIYRQASGDMYMYQDAQYVWYISATLYEDQGYKLKNTTSKEANLLPRKGWECENGDSCEWEKDEKLIIKDASQVTFCNKITISSKKINKKKFLGEFRRVPKVWQNGWPVFKNQDGMKLEVVEKWGTNVLLSSRSSSCPAHSMCGKSECFSEKYWQFCEEDGCQFTDDKTLKLAKEQKPDNDDYDFQFPYIPFALEKDPETDEETDMDVEEVKNVDDHINRIDNLADKKSESSGKAKKTVGSESSEMMKTSFSRNRSIRKITGNMERIGDSKTSSNSTSNSRDTSKTELVASMTSSLSTFTSRGLSVAELVASKISSQSTSTSRGFKVSDINSKSELVPPPKNHKSYSGGYKIPRMKNSESTKPQTAVFPTETVQPHQRSLPSQASNDDGKTGTDSITGKLNAEGPTFWTSPGNSKSEIEILTPTSCPVYGDRYEGIYHSHPKVNKNRSRTSRNGVNSTRVSLGNDWKSGVSSVNHLDHQYPQTSGLNKSNIVDKLLTDASETSNM